MPTAVKRCCLNDLEVLAYVERRAWIGGSVTDPEADAVRSHLDTCLSCSDLIAVLVETRWARPIG